jgi:hypothetical protein
MMKSFFNSHIPDTLIFLGQARVPILASVRQSFCWVTAGDWHDLPDNALEICNPSSIGDRMNEFRRDDYAIVTHSLGSRIAIDTVQYFGELTAKSEELEARKSVMRQKEFRIYMLANQIPVLGLGQEPPSVTGEIASYCRKEGDKYNERLLNGMSVFAFSDPNDILSYGTPPKFVDERMDSRFCPQITNIVLNIAHPISLMGAGDFADPSTAHSGYDHDDRVIAIIAKGFCHDNADEIVKTRCDWIETFTAD